MSVLLNTFKDTLSLASKPLDDSYEGPKVKNVVKLPPLPADAKYTLPPVSGSRVMKLKSIRTPKFELQYAVPNTDTIFSIKERLLTDPNSPLSKDGFYISGVRLLVKAKVLPDCKQVSELTTDELSVVVSSTEDSVRVPLAGEIYFGADAIQTIPKEETPITETTVKLTPTAYPGLNDDFWKEVEHLARKYVEDSQGVVASLKANYESPVDEFNLD